jgi:predicted DsbA family dithiol-disulfide isomerase
LAFPLHPEIPEDGWTLEELFKGRSINLEEVLERLERVAGEEGLPFGKRAMTYNSRLAQELGKWAETKGLGEDFHKAVFHAYFAEGRNIGKIPVLQDMVEALGLSVDEMKEVLEKRSFRKAVDSDWSLARQWEITAVPTFVIQNRAVVGAQPYEVLEKFVVESGIGERRL